MSLSRRELIKLAELAGAGGLLGRSSGATAATRPIAWRNWSGAQAALPAQRFAPASEDELAGWLRSARGVVRPVGSGHSFSALVPTDDNIVSLSRLSGLIDHDPASRAICRTCALGRWPIGNTVAASCACPSWCRK